MYRVFVQLFTLSAALLLVGCSGQLGYLKESLISRAKVSPITLAGEELRLVSWQSNGESGQIPVFFIGGSGCTSLRTYLVPYFSATSRKVHVVGVEKAGVKDKALGRSCSDAFWQSYTYDELLRRNSLALDHFIKTHQSAGDVSVVGVSEGGAIALELAATRTDIDNLVVIGAGAMTQREELGLLAEEGGWTDSLKSSFAAIEAKPESVAQRQMGMSHRYWSSALDRNVRELADQVTARSLFVIGEKDDRVPVVSARLGDELVPNSTLIVWPDADHVFDTPTGSERDQMIEAALDFLDSE